MTLSEQVEDILGETVSALSRLQTDELNDLEKRLILIAGLYGPGSAQSTHALQGKMDQLQACLNVTAENLAVIDRIRSRRMMA